MARYDLSDRDQIEAARKRRSKEIQERRKKKASQRRPPGADTVPKESKRRPAGASTTSAAIEELLRAKQNMRYPAGGIDDTSVRLAGENRFEERPESGQDRIDYAQRQLDRFHGIVGDQARRYGAPNPAEGMLEFLTGSTIASLLPGGTPANWNAKGIGIEGAIAAIPVAGKFLNPIIGSAARAGVRQVARGGQAALPASNSLLGRTVDNAITALRPVTDAERNLAQKTVLRPLRSQAERDYQELARTQKTTSRVVGTQKDRLSRVAATLSPEQQYALLVEKEAIPWDQRIKLHVDELKAAEQAGDDAKILAQQTHVDNLVKIKQKGLIEVGADGMPVLSAKARKSWRMRESSRLMDATDDGRERFLDVLHGSLPSLFPDGAARQVRTDKVARVYAGARWYEPQQALKDERALRAAMRGEVTGAIKAFRTRRRELNQQIARLTGAQDKHARDVLALAKPVEYPVARQAERAVASGSRELKRLMRDANKAEWRAYLAEESLRLSSASGRELAKLADDTQAAVGEYRSILDNLERELRVQDDRLAAMEFAQTGEHGARMAASEGIRSSMVQMEAARGMRSALSDHLARQREALDQRLTELARARSEGIEEIRAKADTLVGAEDVTGTGQFFSKTPGVPGTMSQVNRGMGTLMRPFVSRKAGQAVKQAPQLARGENKTFTGKSILSGMFRTDAAQMKADQATTVQRAFFKNETRKLLLGSRFTVDQLPEGANVADWLPVYTDEALLNPSMLNRGREQLSEALRTLEQAAAGGEVAAQEVLNGADAFKMFSDVVTPWAHGGLDSPTMKAIVAEAVANGGKAPGMKWVPVDAVRGLGLLDPHPILRSLVTRGDGKVARTIFGAYNDYTRAFLLYLNPAYVPVNFVSNAGMNLVQQGMFMPRNAMIAGQLWYRAGKARKEGPWADVLDAMDRAMGEGSFMATTQATTLTRGATHALANTMGAIADRGPRRMAFIHEAAARGYKNADQIGALLTKGMKGSDDALAQIDLIARKAKDAIVDYERATHPLERNVLTNALMFYPWLRGSTRWTARFALDHPFQAAAVGYAGKEYADLSEERRAEMGLDRVPESLRSFMPIGVRDDGSVYGIDAKNLFTGSQPVDLARAVYGFATGDESVGREVLGQMSPMIQNAVTAGTGRNQFGTDVGMGPMTFLEETAGLATRSQATRAAQLAADQLGIRDFNEQPANALYPRTKVDEAIGLVAGRSTAPKPVNPEKAQEYAVRELPTEERQQVNDADELAEQMDAYRQFPQLDADQLASLQESLQSEQWISRRRDDLYEAARDELEIDNLPKREELKLGAQAAVERLEEAGHPLAARFRDAYETALEERDLSLFEDIMEAAERRLGIDFLREARSAARKRGYLAE